MQLDLVHLLRKHASHVVESFINSVKPAHCYSCWFHQREQTSRIAATIRARVTSLEFELCPLQTMQTADSLDTSSTDHYKTASEPPELPPAMQMNGEPT